VKVDVVSKEFLNKHIRDQVLEEAVYPEPEFEKVLEELY
jgi:hypothetical protein